MSQQKNKIKSVSIKKYSFYFVWLVILIVATFGIGFLLQLRSAEVLRLAQLHSDQPIQLSSDSQTTPTVDTPVLTKAPLPSPTSQAKNLQLLPPLWPGINWGEGRTVSKAELLADSDGQSLFQFGHSSFKVWEAHEKNTNNNMLRFYSEIGDTSSKVVDSPEKSMYPYYKKALTNLGWQEDTYYAADGPNFTSVGFIGYQGGQVREIILSGATTEDATQRQCGSGGCNGPSTHNYKIYVSDIGVEK